jgi:hypothetical protein
MQRRLCYPRDRRTKHPPKIARKTDRKIVGQAFFAIDKTVVFVHNC